LPVRPAVDVRARVHGHQARRQHQRRSRPRPRPVRHDVRDHHRLRPLGGEGLRPPCRVPRCAGRQPRGPGGGRMIPALAAQTTTGSPALNITIFVVFVVTTLTIVIKVASGHKTASQMYTGGAAFSGKQNGLAIAGDYLSAASFLGIAGAIALQGYDGFLYSIGFLVAWLVALLLVAELFRNTGRFTLADVLSYRLQQRPMRIATASSVLAVSF